MDITEITKELLYRIMLRIERTGLQLGAYVGGGARQCTHLNRHESYFYIVSESDYTDGGVHTYTNRIPSVYTAYK